MIRLRHESKLLTSSDYVNFQNPKYNQNYFYICFVVGIIFKNRAFLDLLDLLDSRVIDKLGQTWVSLIPCRKITFKIKRYEDLSLMLK